MRIYTRQVFLTLPPGTVFCKGKPWYFNGFMVKGESIDVGDIGDFMYQALDWIDRADDNDQWAKLEAMLEQGASVPLNTRAQRDGCYDEEELFLVYEWADLDALNQIIWAAMYHGDAPREETA